jgi:hypothetical protein
VDKFGRADQLFYVSTLLLGLARAHAGKLQLVTAVSEYQRVVREGTPEGSPQQFVEAVEDAKKELAALEPRIPWVTLNIVGPSSPVVTLDGVAIPPAGLGERRAINPGSHTVKASAEGFIPVERGFNIAEGANEKFALMLERDNTPAVPPPGAAPDTGSGRGKTMKTIGVIGLVVGGVGLVAGGITGALALNEHSVLVDDCPKNKCPSKRQTTLDNFHALSTISTIGFIVGGVGVAGGITLLVLAPSSKSGSKDAAAPKQARVTPYIGVGEIGAVGRF